MAEKIILSIDFATLKEISSLSNSFCTESSDDEIDGLIIGSISNNKSSTRNSSHKSTYMDSNSDKLFEV